MATRPHIVIFDLAVEKGSPAGSCVLVEIEGLVKQFDITVFSGSCEVADLPGVNWVYIPLLRRPVLIRYCLFQIIAPPVYMLWRFSGKKPDYIQGTQGQFVGADVVYAHFCHRAYMKGPWRLTTVRGLRRYARWLTHVLNGYFEKAAVYRAKTIVVPSRGLGRLLSLEYPAIADRIITIANPVDTERFARPVGFDRMSFRRKLSVDSGEIALSFMALGDFDRKGLGLLIEALFRIPKAVRNLMRLIVIGGQRGEIESFNAMALRKGMKERVTFVGLQSDVRPYLWATDAFVFPSAYETFPLAILQAAAAGLPVLVSEGLYGAEDLVRDGRNGWVVERNEESIAHGLCRIAADRDKLSNMGVSSAETLQEYSPEIFRERWISLYTSNLSPRVLPQDTEQKMGAL